MTRRAAKRRPKADPGEMFRCERFACVLSRGACVDRQVAKRRHAAKGSRETTLHDYCASGECAQGAEVRRSIPHYEPRKTLLLTGGTALVMGSRPRATGVYRSPHCDADEHHGCRQVGCGCGCHGPPRDPQPAPSRPLKLASKPRSPPAEDPDQTSLPDDVVSLLRDRHAAGAGARELALEYALDEADVIAALDELPAPPQPEDPAMSDPKPLTCARCRKATLRADNTTGICKDCRDALPTNKRPKRGERWTPPPGEDWTPPPGPRNCPHCGFKLARHNKTGVCGKCQAKSRARRGASGEKATRAATPSVPIAVVALPEVAELPNDYLALCAAEARRRVRDLEAELQRRTEELEALQEAIAE